MKLFSTHVSSWENIVLQLVNGHLMFAFTDLVCFQFISEKQLNFLVLSWKEWKMLIYRYFMELVNDVIPVDMLPYLSCLKPIDKEINK